MKYLDENSLASISAAEFQGAHPYPWLNPEGLLTEAGHQALVRNTPDLCRFRKVFGKPRKHGQASHDRFVLDYEDQLPVDACWHEFIGELSSPAYRDFICRLFGVRGFDMRLHWHYTPTGCSVSPHCDADRKIGSHIFYLNTAEDWREDWGGQTLILNDDGRFNHRNAPSFDDFKQQIAVRSTGNHSLLFARVRHSWHGVQPIRCPAGRYRKAFIVVFETAGGWLGSVRRLVSQGGN